MIEIPDNYQHSVGIVVVGYNRIESIKRLLGSLLLADYPKDSIPLVISIDASGDLQLYNYVKRFEWPYGEKYVNIQEKRLGLKDHIFQCGDLTEHFRGIILLEDDLFVSNCFYHYSLAALDAYSNENRIAEISLYKNEVEGSLQLPKLFLHDGSDSFLVQSVVSWGQCWSKQMWRSFRKWLEEVGDIDWNEIEIPDYMKSWNKAWSKFFNAYLTKTDRYVLMPSVSLTTNFSEIGENSSSLSCLGQVNLMCGHKEFYFKDFYELVKYDIYGYNQDIYKWLGLSKEEVFLNIWGHSKYKGQPYVLTPLKIKKGHVSLVQSFGLQLRPIELNIKYRVPGEDIFLYKVSDYQENFEYPISYAYYFIRTFNNKLLVKYVLNQILTSLKRRIKALIK